MATLVFNDIREKESIFGLTVGKDFKSSYAKLKAEREQRVLKITNVTTKYHGKVPLHQRLVLLCADFLESTKEFELNELINFSDNIYSLDKILPIGKVEKLNSMIKELYQKYQIEIVQPNLEYLIDKYKTASQQVALI